MSAITEQIEALFEQQGQTHYGENISQLEHALQTAHLAFNDGHGDYFIVACLLHDIGHLHYAQGLAYRGIDGEHEDLGANWLASGFPPEVTEPIRLHVAAKRYLCSIDDSYYDSLSLASKRSMLLQGGMMNPLEQKRFANNIYHIDAIKLRQYDDLAKISDLEVYSFTTYLPMLERVSQNRDAG